MPDQLASRSAAMSTIGAERMRSNLARRCASLLISEPYGLACGALPEPAPSPDDDDFANAGCAPRAACGLMPSRSSAAGGEPPAATG